MHRTIKHDAVNARPLGLAAASIATLVLATALLVNSAAVQAATGGGQNFFGFGPGIEVLSNNGSGTGFYIQGFGGHSFDSIWAAGLHAGYSNVGGVGISTVDFGAFGQATDPDSGLYGRFYLDGMYGTVSGGGTQHGIAGSQTVFAPGLGMGMLIPASGTFHMVPEVSYRLACFQNTVNVIDVTFSVMWDF